MVLLTSRCNEDFLEREPLDMLSSEQVFNDENFVEAYLYQIYNYMPCGYGQRDNGAEVTPGVNTIGYGNAYILDCCTDIFTNKSNWPGSNKLIIPGSITPSNNDLSNWNHCYTAIRYCNDLLVNMEKSTLDPAFVARVSAEARFVRAFQYFDLVRRYGGVPLITKLQTLEDFDAIMVSRNTADEVYDFLDAEYTTIAEALPSQKDLPESELGRATKEACWAFNGKINLFAERWARSAEKSKKVIDAGVYTLSPDYNKLFQSYGGDKEVIFEVMFNGAEKGHSFDLLAYPFSFRSDWGSQILPTQELVDAYEMTNGLPITDPNSGYDPNNPYANRDNRLAATVLYNGNTFKGKVMDYTSYYDSKKKLLPLGPDGPNPSEVNKTITGYNIKKFLDEAIPDGPGWGVSKTSWKELRYAEVLMNYAEAQNNAVGPDASVYNTINQVRTRAGQPNLPSGLSKEEMFKRIVNERKVEFAGEGHRYWDLRRWKMMVEVMHQKNVHRLFAIKNMTTNEITYELGIIDKTKRPTSVFIDAFYLMPIPLSEMDKNPNLVQNPGY